MRALRQQQKRFSPTAHGSACLLPDPHGHGALRDALRHVEGSFGSTESRINDYVATATNPPPAPSNAISNLHQHIAGNGSGYISIIIICSEDSTWSGHQKFHTRQHHRHALSQFIEHRVEQHQAASLLSRSADRALTNKGPQADPLTQMIESVEVNGCIPPHPGPAMAENFSMKRIQLQGPCYFCCTP